MLVTVVSRWTVWSSTGSSLVLLGCETWLEIFNLMPRVAVAPETCVCPAIGETPSWKQIGGCGLDPNRWNCAITAWRYTLNALKEFIWSPIIKEEESHVQTIWNRIVTQTRWCDTWHDAGLHHLHFGDVIRGRHTSPTFEDVISGTARYRIICVWWRWLTHYIHLCFRHHGVCLKRRDSCKTGIQLSFTSCNALLM